jgi:hypothetical protein
VRFKVVEDISFGIKGFKVRAFKDEKFIFIQDSVLDFKRNITQLSINHSRYRSKTFSQVYSSRRADILENKITERDKLRSEL